MFLIHSVDKGDVIPWEKRPVAAITPKIGMALVENADGNLTTATGTAKPSYICMCDRSAACTAGELIPVVRVDGGVIFETTFAAAATSIKLGNKVQQHTDGMQVTATTTSGVAEVVYMDGTASGSMCRVRF